MADQAEVKLGMRGVRAIVRDARHESRLHADVSLIKIFSFCSAIVFFFFFGGEDYYLPNKTEKYLCKKNNYSLLLYLKQFGIVLILNTFGVNWQ